MTATSVQEASGPAGGAVALVVPIPVPPAEARSLARTLVEEGRAACVNRLPGARSTYRWQGEVREADEAPFIVKTTRAAYPALERRVLELRPGDVPEVTALPIALGSIPSLDWLQSSVTAA